MKLYKFINPDGTTPQGHGQYHLPKTPNKPGQWLPYLKGPLISCMHGYHVLRPDDLVYWIGAELWEVDCKGEIVESEDKVIVRQVRLVRRIDKWNPVTFAQACADHVKHLGNSYADDAAARAADVVYYAARAADVVAAIYAADAADDGADAADAYGARDDERQWQNNLIKALL